MTKPGLSHIAHLVGHNASATISKAKFLALRILVLRGDLLLRVGSSEAMRDVGIGKEWGGRMLVISRLVPVDMSSRIAFILSIVMQPSDRNIAISRIFVDMNLAYFLHVN